MLEYEKTLPQPDKQILEFMNTYCEQKELPIEIIDLSTLKGRLKAKINGITKTPTITIDQKQIETQPDLDTLKQKLETQLKQSDA
jgi:glutaredoxin